MPSHKSHGRPPTHPFPRIPFADRFWAKVNRLRHPNGSLDFTPCWDWIAPNTTGTQGLTGEIRLPTPSRKRIKAPRAALLLSEGYSDAQLEAANERHRRLAAGHTVCDRPQCCNPTHLAWQPHKANIHEYIRKFGKLAGRVRTPSSATFA